jgi:hypothetical protein
VHPVFGDDCDGALRGSSRVLYLTCDTLARISWTAVGKRAVLVREQLAEAHDTRSQWEAMTEPTCRLARAADP